MLGFVREGHSSLTSSVTSGMSMESCAVRGRGGLRTRLAMARPGDGGLAGLQEADPFVGSPATEEVVLQPRC